MLQICSGKLFQDTVEYRNQLRGIIYTNLRFGFGRDEKLDTEAGSLLSTSNLGLSNAIVYEIEELIESNGQGKGILVSHAVDPYILDFSTIISFALNCTASPSYTLTDRLLSNQKGVSTHTVPSKVVKSFFDKDVYCTEADGEHLRQFVKHLIGLERQTYLSVMRAIRTYVTGIQRVADDFELAYTLLVASIESLAQDFDGHKSSWSSYDQKKRSLIDKALSGASNEVSESVRKAILDIEHTSLGRRFRDFSIEHLKPSYFREEAVGVVHPISKYDLPKALANAYQARSQYIHNLRTLPSQLTNTIEYSESTQIDNKAWLTIQGLSRLARHIITEFVQRQVTIDKEVYNYSLERSGIIQMKLAPQYWVGRTELYHGSGSEKLEGFLSQIASHMSGTKGGVATDLRELLTKVEKSIHELKKEDKLPYIALYFIFNASVSEEQMTENTVSFNDRFNNELMSPSSESLLVHSLFNITPPWEMDEYHRTLMRYFEKRDNRFSFRAPVLFEAGMILSLAESYRVKEDLSTAVNLVSMAVENYPGHEALIQFEQDFKLESKPIEWQTILMPKIET
ncbi:hypothetical protein [Photobacterium aquimaris]|uniref:Uncharacterized protein n=1 Tax=Photobacterium aquimaris TaxID=512643 RepID=A0A2T3I0L6_9GAMM|nr:hypothetical protein [Photobacterium aquimaris]OBU25583.1 hypothetical protein AYY21_08355 [Photobacterium aquimaris]PQJ37118.1 hypothetical protein BTN98_18430 [Photobacterium aquimaris]PSU10026.1 hypothetical protein C0W81_04705 [Photobacterium aquimaris]